MSSIEQDRAAEPLRLAWKDTEILPAEQRAYVLLPIAARMSEAEPDTTYVIVNQIVKAYNDAGVNPRRGRFDPTQARSGFKLTPNAAPDANLLVRGGRGVYEVIDSGRTRHSFLLQAPGVGAFHMPDLLRAAARRCDLDRLEPILLEHRHEVRVVQGLIALAEMQIRLSE